MTLRLGFILTLALLSISSTPLVIRYVVGVPAIVLAFWRMLTASGLLWAYSAVKHQGSLTLQQKKLIILAGIFLGCHFACFFVAVRNTSIANATFLGCMAPVFTVVIAFFQKKPNTLFTYLGLALALVGAIIIQASELSIGADNVFGNSIALLGAFFISLTFVIAREIRKNTDTITYSRMLFFIAALTLLLISFLSGDFIFQFQFSHLPWILFLGFVPSILGHNLLNYGLKYITPTAITSIPLGEPIIASIFGVLLFNESVPGGALIGGPIILIGILIVLLNEPKDQ